MFDYNHDEIDLWRIVRKWMSRIELKSDNGRTRVFTLPELPSPTRTIFTCFSYASPSESDIFQLPINSLKVIRIRGWIICSIEQIKKKERKLSVTIRRLLP